MAARDDHGPGPQGEDADAGEQVGDAGEGRSQERGQDGAGDPQHPGDELAPGGGGGRGRRGRGRQRVAKDKILINLYGMKYSGKVLNVIMDLCFNMK